MASGMPLAGSGAYAAFLRAQGDVRRALEAAFADIPPHGLPAPPLQTPLIDADLRDLGQEPLGKARAIQFETPFCALGAAWVVAGSSLGNRTMLAQRMKAGKTSAQAFFADTAMPAYFKYVLDALEAPFTDQQITQISKGAHLVFEMFEQRFAALQQDRAA